MVFQCCRVNGGTRLDLQWVLDPSVAAFLENLTVGGGGGGAAAAAARARARRFDRAKSCQSSKVVVLNKFYHTDACV
jgi:hypothetical protein